MVYVPCAAKVLVCEGLKGWTAICGNLNVYTIGPKPSQECFFLPAKMSLWIVSLPPAILKTCLQTPKTNVLLDGTGLQQFVQTVLQGEVILWEFLMVGMESFCCIVGIEVSFGECPRLTLARISDPLHWITSQ